MDRLSHYTTWPGARERNSAYVRPWADEVVSSYTIMFAAFILTAGALGDRIGAKRIFMAGSPSSTWHRACALAPTAIVLLAARAMQGLGGAPLFRTRRRG